VKLLSDADWQALQQRADLPTFAAARQRLRSEVAALLVQPVTVPDEPGGYYHDYFCPEHGVQLHFDPATPHTHRCPLDNKLWQDERFDAAWRWFVNNRLAEGAIRLALLWRLEGNPAHLAAVVDTLTGYAAHYAGYQQVPRTVANPGVATYTTLDESVWVLPLAWAFDLVRDQVDEPARTQIAEGLFAPVAAHLVAHHFQGIHNFACWHNAAIGTLGVVLDRADLIEFAIAGDFGFDTQLRLGVLADGFWFEGSLSYHFYTVYALLTLAKATRHVPGHDLRQRPQLRAMLLAPIQSAYPDWSLPAPNDCWYFISLLADCCHGVPQAPAFYEIATAWYDEPHFGQVLQRAYQQSPRDSLDALLFGQAELPSTALVAVASAHLSASGYAILRATPEAHLSEQMRNHPEAQLSEQMRNNLDAYPDQEIEQRYLLLKYGPHGGGHGHPDKLNMILYAHGQRLSPDLGTPGYGLDLFESWYRQTVSHNTITLDGRSQPEATGQAHTFRSDGPFQIADASVTWTDADVGPYQNVTMRRVLLAQPDYFLDLVLVEAPDSHRVDWIYHNAGTLATALPAVAYDTLREAGEGYSHITQAQAVTTDTAFTVNWQINEVGLQLFVAGMIGMEVITGRVPGNPPGDQLATLIQRRQTAQTAFLSLFHPFRKAPTVTAVEWIERNLLETGWAGCRVVLGEHSEYWLIQRTSDGAVPAWFAELADEPKFIYCLEA